MAEEDVQEDALLGGRLRLWQPTRGHRAGTDAILLAAAAPIDRDIVAVDIGSGVGTVGLALALRAPDLRVRLVEREPLLAGMARRNIALNGLDARAVVEEADVLADPRPLDAARRAALVVSNPPFYAASATRPSPDGLKSRAYGAVVGHDDWLRMLLRWASADARIVLIHRPEALPMLLSGAGRTLGGLRIMPILPRAGQPAHRVLFGGTVGSRAPLTLLPPLILHRNDGSFTEEASALHRGEATLALFDPQTRRSRPQGPASV